MTPGAWSFMTPGARLAGFIKRTTIHCYTQIGKLCALWFRRRNFFYVLPIVNLWELMTPRAGPFLTPGAWLAGFTKRTTTHCYIQNMKALCLVLLEKIFLCFSHDTPPPPPPGAGPVWTPGARLAGFIKRTTIHCYTQNMKALGHVVLGKKIFYVLYIVSLWKLSVAMETRVLMQPDPKPNTTFPPPQ